MNMSDAVLKRCGKFLSDGISKYLFSLNNKKFRTHRFGKRTIYLQLIFVIYFFSVPSLFSQKAATQTAFGVGEKLLFDVNYGIITAGYAEMSIPSLEVVNDTTCYRIVFSVRSTPTFDFFFKVRDQYETYLDTAGIFSRRFEQHVNEGKYHRNYKAVFDYSAHIARTDEGDFPISSYVHDIMSAFYYTRTLNLSTANPGDRFPMQNFMKGKVNPLAVKYIGKQRVKVSAGTFDCLVVEPLVVEGGLFKSEGRILIWLSDDERKIPVKVSTKIIIGTIDAELREYSGLRGTLTAKH